MSHGSGHKQKTEKKRSYCTQLTPNGSGCLCGGCGEYFWSMETFDKHRPGKPGATRPCIDPEKLGMKLYKKSQGMFWDSPERIEKVQRQLEKQIGKKLVKDN